MTPEDKAEIKALIAGANSGGVLSNLSFKDILPWLVAGMAAFFAVDKNQATSGVATAVSVEAISLQITDMKADVAGLQAKLERPRFTQEDFDRQIQPFLSKVQLVTTDQSDRDRRLTRVETRLIQIEKE